MMRGATITVIGIDCACDPRKVGLARATHKGRQTYVEEVRCCSKSEPPDEVVGQWIEKQGGRVMLALDAPLGWPASLQRALENHKAGEEIECDANLLFRRETDRFVRERVNKQPLDVGADRIARTAHAAVGLLGSLREKLAHPIPLIWGRDFAGIGAIEVYPAGTAKAHGIRLTGYKKDGDRLREVEKEVLERLHFSASVDAARNDNEIDAVLCVLAAHDFLVGGSFPPTDKELARQEG